MPENIEQFLWYALNGCFLIIIWFVRGDLKDIKSELRRGHNNYHNMYVWMVEISTKFNMLHPEEKPISPPKWEE